MPRYLECNEKFEKKYPNQMGKFRFCLSNEECISAFNRAKQEYHREQSSKARKPINKVSEKTGKLTREYLKNRKDFIVGKICPVTNKPSTEIHHMNGRQYDRLNDESEWLAVTRLGHGWIHANPKEAREKGWLK